jgi:hypothetical protein
MPEGPDQDEDAKLDGWDSDACILSTSRGTGLDIVRPILNRQASGNPGRLIGSPQEKSGNII